MTTRPGWKVAQDVGNAAALEGRLAAAEARGEITLIDGITQLAEAIQHLDGTLGEWVQAARDAGHSWSEIGDGLGVSKQSAWERFSR